MQQRIHVLTLQPLCLTRSFSRDLVISNPSTGFIYCIQFNLYSFLSFNEIETVILKSA